MWFLVESEDDITLPAPKVRIVKRSEKLQENVKPRMKQYGDFDDLLSKAELAYREELGAGSIVYLRKIFEKITVQTANAVSIQVLKPNGRQRPFKELLEEVDKQCHIVPPEFSANGYRLFGELYLLAFADFGVWSVATDKLIENQIVFTDDLPQDLAQKIYNGSDIEKVVCSYYFGNNECNMERVISRCQQNEQVQKYVELYDQIISAEYVPVKTRSDSYQSEAALEKEFIRLLCEQGYEYLPIHSEAELIANLRKKLEELNGYIFTDSEWERFFSECIANANDGIEDKTRRIQEDFVQVLRRDTGESKNITLIDKKNIHNNRLQVINQYVIGKADGARYDNRYDVTVLVNGLPLVHIELKRRGVAIRHAFGDRRKVCVNDKKGQYEKQRLSQEWK